MIAIDGHTLTLAEVEAVARDRAGVRLADEAASRVRASRALLEGLLEGRAPVYGVNTGFGRLADVRIPREEQRALQRNMVRSHAAGAGAPLPASECGGPCCCAQTWPGAVGLRLWCGAAAGFAEPGCAHRSGNRVWSVASGDWCRWRMSPGAGGGGSVECGGRGRPRNRWLRPAIAPLELVEKGRRWRS